MATKIRGITIEIGGDASSFEKSLRDVDNSIKETKYQLKDVEKLLKLDPGNTELLRQKQQLLATAVSETSDKLKQLKEQQATMDANGVDKNSEQYMALQREILSTSKNLEELKSAAASCNPVLEQLAAGADNIAGKLDKASHVMAPFSAAAAGALAGLAGAGYKAVTAADDLNTLSKQTGISTADLQKFQFASDRIDVSLETMTGSMTKLKKNMASSSKDTQAAFEKLGVSVRDVSDGSMRQVTNVFDDVVKALAAIPNETERDQLAMQLFGKSADQLAGVIDDGGEALKAYGEQAEEMGLILSQDTLDRINETNDRIDEMKATFSASLLEVGAVVAEALAPIVTQVSEIVRSIAERLQALTPEQMQVVMGILAVVAAIAPLLSVGAKLFGGISALLTAVSGLSAFISTTLIPAISAVAAPVLAVIAVIAVLVASFKLLYDNSEDFRNKVNEVWAQVQETISVVIEAIQAIIERFIQLVQAAWQRWGDNIVAIAQTIWNLIFTVIEVALGLIKDIVNVVMAAIHGDWSAAWEGIKKLCENLWSGIKLIVKTAIEAVKTVIDNVMTIIKDIWGKAWEWLKQKVSEIWEGIKTTVGNMFDSIKTTVGNIRDTIVTTIGEAVEYIKGLPAQALQWGKDLISNFVDGIKGAWQDLKDGISGVAEGIADFIAFSEPKKGPLSNFHTYAPDMMQLFAEGIRDNLGLVTSAMEDVSGAVAGGVGQMAMVNVTTNTILNGRIIASEINQELGEML